MQITDELKVLVEAEVARAVENFKKLSDSIDKSEQKTKTLGDALDTLSKKSLIISAAVTGAGGASLKFAVDNEKLKTSLEVLLKSADKASNIFEEWKKFGASTPLSLDEIAGAGKSLLAFGIDASDVTDTLRRLGDVSQGVGTGLDQITQVYGKIKVQGRATAQEILQLQRAGVPAVQALAKALGVAESEIGAMVSAGKIGFPEIEKAFKVLTENGGQFEGMMDKLSQTTIGKFSTAVDNAKQAAAAFGELMLPLANDLLDKATNLFTSISDMDDGTKRFVFGMGGVIAISGPAISAIKGINAAMTALAANPYLLAIGGTVAAVGVVAGLINKQTHAYEDLNTQIHKTKNEADGLLSSYADGNRAKTLDEETTRNLIRLYPSLTGEITAYATTVDEAAAAVKKLTEAEVENAANKMIERLRRQTEAAETAAAAYEDYNKNVVENIEMAERTGDFREIKQYQEAIETHKYSMDSAVERAEATRRQINAELAKIGKALGEDFAIVDIPITITPNVEALAETFELPAATQLKKRWQEWFGEITNIDPAAIVRRGETPPGIVAAKIFIADFERGLAAQRTIADALGEQLDIAGILRSRQDEVQKALVELLSIDPSQIDDPFEVVNGSIQALIEEYKRLGDAAQEAYNKATVTDSLESLREEVQNLGKDKYDLVLATMAAANATSAEMIEAKALIQTLREASLAVEELGLSFEEFLTQRLSDNLQDIFPELEKQAAEAIANINTRLAMLSFEGVLNGLNAVGEAWAKGENAAESFKQATAQMARQILNQLPMMFLQAGLQLIAQGQWPLGLGFVAAAGSSAIIAGYTNGRMENETANAHGNAYDHGSIAAFAHGGSFTNQIVNAPTHFRYGGKLGLMGEAGPEAIMPLKKMPSGNLGVEAAGSGSNVTITINNYSGASVKKEETEDAYGNRNVNIDIGEIINSHLVSGKADRAMAGRFGARPVGV